MPAFLPWRKQYGKDLRGVGGMNKTVFAHDRAAVDAEVERLGPWWRWADTSRARITGSPPMPNGTWFNTTATVCGRHSHRGTGRCRRSADRRNSGYRYFTVTNFFSRTSRNEAPTVVVETPGSTVHCFFCG